MAKYRKVDTRFWNDEGVQSLPPLDKLVAIYCLTAQVNRVGIFKFSVALASEDLGIDPQGLREAVGRVCQTLSWRYDEARRVLYMPQWWRYNNPGSADTMKGYLGDLDELPKTPLLQAFAQNDRWLSTDCARRVREAVGDPVGDGVGDQEQEQEQEQEQDSTVLSEQFASSPSATPPPAPAKKKPRKNKPPEPVTDFVFPIASPEGEPKEFAVPVSLLGTLVETYTAVDVEEELRKARAWVVTNPDKKKTKRGMPAFLNRWMTKVQDRGGNSRSARQSSPNGRYQMPMLEVPEE